MEIILLENVRKLGTFGQTVKVKDGFARNFLIPNQKALRATEANKKHFESRRAEIEKENGKKHEEAGKSAAKMEGKVVTLIRQAGEDGRLYGSVTAADIAKVTSGAKETIEKGQVRLDKPVKTIGIFQVRLNLHGDVEAIINVNVARSEAEAKDAATKWKRGEYVNPADTAAKKSYEEIVAEAEQQIAAEAPEPEESSGEAA